MSATALFRKPSAFLPLAMSAVALLLIGGHLALVGDVRQPDEGTAARVFQLLMAAQLPLMVWFAARWLPREGPSAARVLLAQATAWIVPIVLILLLESRGGR
ncbi:MAG: hypothetical protein AB7L66_07120 [Gemmatimonadales bacterium]